MTPDPIRFAHLDKSGVAIATVRESEARAHIEGFAASNALYKRGWIDGYMKALKKTGVQTTNAERLAQYEEWHREDAENAYAENHT